MAESKGSITTLVRLRTEFVRLMDADPINNRNTIIDKALERYYQQPVQKPNEDARQQAIAQIKKNLPELQF
jgi:hypothetical protein